MMIQMKMPPDLLVFDDYGNDWEPYDGVLNHVFQSEIMHGNLHFQDLLVKCRRYSQSKILWFHTGTWRNHSSMKKTEFPT